MASSTPPAGLKAGGAAFWAELTGEFQFDVAELRILADCCREIDLIDRLQAEADAGEAIVKGSMGQDVANPMFGELAKHRNLLRGLIRDLRLPSEGGADSAGARSASARQLAEHRWRGAS